MKDYNIKITWSDVTVMYPNGTSYLRRQKDSRDLMRQFINEYEQYMQEHPEYYGCVDD
jgi:hypothetical protein